MKVNDGFILKDLIEEEIKSKMIDCLHKFECKIELIKFSLTKI